MGATGVVTISGGVTSAERVYIGGSDVLPYGSGILNIGGTGVLTISGYLVAWSAHGGELNLTGGTLNVPAINLNGAPSLLNWTGGTLNLTASVTFDPFAPVYSTSSIFGSSLSLGTSQTLMITGNETLGGAGPFSLTLNSGSSHYVTGTLNLSPNGTITQNPGSSLYAATFIQAGGTVNGTLQNQGNFVYQSGQFNGRLLNQGTVNLGPSFTAPNGVENDMSMTLLAGQTMTVNGPGLDNLGTFLLNGAVVSGAGVIVNESGGVLQGHGTINQVVTNNGVVAVGGLLTFNAGITNNGMIQGNGTLVGSLSNAASGNVNIAAGSQLAISNDWTNAGLTMLQGGGMLGGGAVANAGTIQGAGLIESPINNTGTIEAIGGTLSLGGAILDPAGGLIRVSTGNKLLITQGLLSSAGIVNLIGGTFDNNGQPMNNLGQISGFGTFATGGTGLDNNGSITFSGGLTTVNGPVTNENGKTIVVAYNPAIFTGLVTDNGGATFNIVSTTAVFAGGSSGTFNGTFTNNVAAAFTKAGSGTLEIDGPPTLNNSSAIILNDTGTLRFKALTGTATIGTGVTATINNSATLELAGSVSALSNGPNRVNILNNSTAAAGLLVSGKGQQVGNIDGSGTTQVNAGSDLTANHIVQSALIIGGTPGSPGLVTIDASDASGNPLGQSNGFALAGSLVPRGPFGADGMISANLSSEGGSDIASLSPSSSIVGGGSSSVPEPSTLLLAVLAVLGVISTQFLRRHFRSQTA